MMPRAARSAASLEGVGVRRAWAHAYGLLARLVLEGADGELLREARRTPGLCESFSRSNDDEALAADHYQLFGMMAPPYAALYLADEDEKDGVVEAIRRASASAGFAPTLRDVSHDHLGILLGFLSFAEHAVADALEDDRGALASDLQARVAEFMDRWVLSWLPVWVAAAAPQGGSWGDLASMMGAFAAAHRSALPHPVHARFVEAQERTADLLDDPRTDLRAVGAWLATPRLAGAWLTRRDIAAIARRHGAPCGFGQREQLLENLLRSAASYDELPQVATALQTRCVELDAALDESNVDDELLRTWHEASRHTARMLGRLAVAATSAKAGEAEQRRDALDES